MTIKLHCCPNTWGKVGTHPCFKVQRALDQQGIQYELVPGPLRRSQRHQLEKLSGQRRYPVIEFADGTTYRAESTEMAAQINRGTLFDVTDAHFTPPHGNANTSPGRSL